MSLLDQETDKSSALSWTAPARCAALILVLLAAGLLFFGGMQSPLLEPEEAVYAEVPREMAVTGSWIVPLRLGRPYYEKPPLLYWLIMAGYAAFGVHEWAARLFAGAAGLGTVLVTLWWGTRMFGFRAGLAAAMILCLSPRFVHQARMITMDGLLCICVALSLALGQQAMQPGRLKRGFWFLSAAACGLGVLAKGPVAVILTVFPLFAYRFLYRNAAQPGVRHWLAYLGTAAGLAVPWFVALAWQDLGFLKEYFWTHHVEMRFVRPLHDEPIWFYVPVLLLGMLPWTLLLPGLAWSIARHSPKMPADLKFVLVCCLWCFIFFSAADCKRMGYILPAMPALALALGYALDRRLDHGLRLPFWATQGVLAAGVAGAMLAAYIELLSPAHCLILIVLATAGSIWMIRRRQTPAAAWVACGLATFALLLGAVQILLPNYYRRFSMREQVQSLLDDTYHPQLPVACYPHHWDSIAFYLQRQDVRSYSRDGRDRLLADLERWPTTLVFVKSGPAFEDLLHKLSPRLEFISCGQSRTVTAGVVRRRETTSGQTRLPPDEFALNP
jgi:dolichol-phosphate mannosyltransferase